MKTFIIFLSLSLFTGIQGCTDTENCIDYKFVANMVGEYEMQMQIPQPGSLEAYNYETTVKIINNTFDQTVRVSWETYNYDLPYSDVVLQNSIIEIHNVVTDRNFLLVFDILTKRLKHITVTTYNPVFLMEIRERY